MDSILAFVQSHKLYFDAAYAFSSVLSLIGWSLGLILLFIAWRRNKITGVTFGALGIQFQHAVEATAAAARNWSSPAPDKKIDISRIRRSVGRAFEPTVYDNLIGKRVLWVDDNPDNNELVARALRRLGLDVEQVTSTETALGNMERSHYDLVISDMGRGSDMQAGYRLLHAIRERGSDVPFAIFAGSDAPEFRRIAAARGAQLSTNDVVQLIDFVVNHLGH